MIRDLQVKVLTPTAKEVMLKKGKTDEGRRRKQSSRCCVWAALNDESFA